MLLIGTFFALPEERLGIEMHRQRCFLPLCDDLYDVVEELERRGV